MVLCLFIYWVKVRFLFYIWLMLLYFRLLRYCYEFKYWVYVWIIWGMFMWIKLLLMFRIFDVCNFLRYIWYMWVLNLILMISNWFNCINEWRNVKVLFLINYIYLKLWVILLELFIEKNFLFSFYIFLWYSVRKI